MKNAKLGSKVLAIVLSLLMAFSTTGFAENTVLPTSLDDDAGRSIQSQITTLVPTAMDDYSIIKNARNVVSAGDYLFFGTGNDSNGLCSYNVKTGARVTGITGRLEPNGAHNLLVEGNYIYAAENTGLIKRVDISDPANPVVDLVVAISRSVDGATGAVSYGGLYGVFRGMVKVGDRLFVFGNYGPRNALIPENDDYAQCSAGGTPNLDTYEYVSHQSADHGYIINASNNLTLYGNPITQMDTGAYSVFADGGYLYIIKDGVLEVVEEDEIFSESAFSSALYAANKTSVAFTGIDVTKIRTLPVKYGNYLLYAADKLLVFDMTNPAAPVQVNVGSNIEFAGPNYGMAINDGVLYVTNGTTTVKRVKLDLVNLSITSGATATSAPFTLEGECAGGEAVMVSIQSADMEAPFVAEADVIGNSWSYEIEDIYDDTYEVEVSLLNDSEEELATVGKTITVTGVAGTSGVPASSNTSVNDPDAAELQISTANLAGSGSGKTASVTGVVPMGDRIGYKEVTLTVTDEAGTYTYYEGTQKCFGNFVFDAVALDETSDTIAEGDTVKFIVQSEDGDDDERSSVYYSDAYLNEAYAAISGKADIADIEDAIDTYNDVYQLDVEGDFAGLSSPEEVLGALLGKTYTKDAPIELLNDFNEAVAAQVEIDVVLLEIKDAATDALAVEVLDDPANQTILGIPLALTPYGALGADVKASLLAEIRAIEPLKRADIIEVLEFDRCLLLLVNTSSGAALEDALLTYNTQLGISAANVTKYNNLLPGKKTRVLSDVVREDESEYFATLVEAGNAFEDAVIYYESLVEASTIVINPQETTITIDSKSKEAVTYGDYIFFSGGSATETTGLASYNVRTGVLTTGISPRMEPNGGTNMILIGTDLYIATAHTSSYAGRIICYDISNPANPVEKAVIAASINVDPETGENTYGTTHGVGHGFTTYGNMLFYHGNYGVKYVTLPVTENTVAGAGSYEHYSGYHRMHFEDDEHTYAIVSGNKLLDVNRYSIEFDTAYSITTHNGYMYVVKDNALKAISKATAYGAGEEINPAAYASGGTTVAIEGVDESMIMTAGAIYDNFLVYAADKLLVFDISNPAAPVRVNIPDIASSGNIIANGNSIYYWNGATVKKANLDLATVTVSSATTVSALPFAMEGTVRNGSKVKLTFDNSIITTPIVREATVSGNTWVYSLTDIYNGTYDVEIALYDSGDNKLCSVTQTITVTGGEGTVGPFTGANNTENGADAAAVSIESTLVNSSKVATVTGKIPMGNRIGYKEVTLTIKNEAGATVYTGIQKSRGQYNFTAQLPLDTPEGAAFTAEVTCDGYLTPATREFHYFSESYRETAYAAISGKSDIADIEAAIATYNDVYQLPVEGDYATLRSQDEALAMMLGETFSKDAPEYLIMYFNVIVDYQTQVDDVIEAILAAETNALALEVLTNETTGFDNQELLLLEDHLEEIAPFGDLSEAGKNALMAKIRANANITRAEVAEILTYDSILLLLVNTSSDADLEDALLTYSTDLEIAADKVTKYNGAKLSEKNKVLRAVARANEGEYFSTLAAAGDKFEVEVNANVGNGGGGGSLSSKEPGTSDDDDLKGDKAPITSIKGNTETPDVAIKSVFSDIKEAAWAEKYIMYLYNNQIVNGKSKEKFAPNDNITREEFVKIIVMAIGEKGEMGETEFTDVDSNAWYAPYLNTAIRLGIIKGVDEDTFGIGSEITREQMAVIIHRAAAVKNKKFSTTTEKTFTDSVADYATEAVDALSGAGIINGYEDGTFRGNKTATRAESAKIIYGYLMMK